MCIQNIVLYTKEFVVPDTHPFLCSHCGNHSLALLGRCCIKRLRAFLVRTAAIKTEAKRLRAALAELVAAYDEHRLAQAEHDLAFTVYTNTCRSGPPKTEGEQKALDETKKLAEEYGEADKKSARREADAWAVARALANKKNRKEGDDESDM